MTPNFEHAIGKFTTAEKTVEIYLEVANTPDKIAQGFMNRYFLPEGSGMVFLHGKESTQSFWMLNTDLPLSIAFYDQNGTILDIQDMEPYSLDAHAPKSPYVGAIEVNQGLFERLGIKPGDKVEVVEDNHPVMLNEEILYNGDHAKATHEGLSFGEDQPAVQWADIDDNLIHFPYPRTIKHNGNKRNFLGFKTVSFVETAAPRKKKPLTDEESKNLDLYMLNESDVDDIRSNLTSPPDSWVSKFTDPERASRSWDHLFRSDGPYGRHGIEFNGIVDRLVRGTKQMLTGVSPVLGRRHTPEELTYAANFYQHQAAAPKRVGEHLGFSPEASSQVIAHLSSHQLWHPRRGEAPHNSNVDAALHAYYLVHKASTDGLDLTQEHIDAIQKNHRLVSQSPEVQSLRRVVDIDKNRAPSTPGRYKLEDIDDVSLATLLTGGNKMLEKVKAISSLTSERRPDHPARTFLQRPMAMEDLLSDDFKAGKTSSFFENIMHPLKSTRATWDKWMKRGYISSKLGKDEFTDMDEASDRGRGRPPGAKTRDPKAPEPLYEHGAIRSILGGGAGYQVQDVASREAARRLLTMGITDSPITAQQSLQWRNAQETPSLAPKGDRERPSEAAAELSTPLNKLWVPPHYEGHEDQPSSQQDRFCREIHPMRRLMNELAEKATIPDLVKISR